MKANRKPVGIAQTSRSPKRDRESRVLAHQDSSPIRNDDAEFIVGPFSHPASLHEALAGISSAWIDPAVAAIKAAHHQSLGICNAVDRFEMACRRIEMTAATIGASGAERESAVREFWQAHKSLKLFSGVTGPETVIALQMGAEFSARVYSAIYDWEHYHHPERLATSVAVRRPQINNGSSLEINEHDGDDPLPTPHPSLSGRPVYCGGGEIRFGNGESIRLEGAEAEVIDALVTKGPLSKRLLVELSGVDNAVAVIRRVHDKFPALQDWMVSRPGKGGGGYRVNFATPEQSNPNK